VGAVSKLTKRADCMLARGLPLLPLLQLLLQDFYFPISFFRWIVMRTSKIPQ
jgi:hypothetical protein